MKSSPRRSVERGSAPAPAVAAGRGRAAEWLERGAFFALLLLIGMRPLLSETYESAEGMFAEYVRGVDVATPATTAGFDVVIWLAALATAGAALWRRKLAASPFQEGSTRRAELAPSASEGSGAKGVPTRRLRSGLVNLTAGPGGWRWTGLEIGFVCMAVAAGVSTVVAASNKRLALNASADWLSAVVLAMVVANLCRDRLRVALVLAVIAAAGATSAAKSVMQVTTEFRETREDYESNKDKLWGEVPPDDPRRLLYERRMNANEATGFLSHSNVQGSLLLLCGFGTMAAGGLARSQWVRCALYAGGVALLATIGLTGSRGAMLAAGGGLALLAAVCVVPRTFSRLGIASDENGRHGGRPLQRTEAALRRHWRAALAAGWGLVVLGGIGVTLLGVARGGLPGSSLGFRWNYWQVTSAIVGEHPWTGVGALNYDRAYMQHKPIDFPEEIRDPHNFVLSILAQWGVLGAIGLTLALVGGSIVAVRAWAENKDLRFQDFRFQIPDGTESGVEPRQELSRWLLAVAAGYVLLRIWLMRGLLSTGSGQAQVFVDVVQYGAIWAGTFLAIAVACTQGVGQSVTGFRLAVFCGIGAFLLHNTIDFSLFVPGAMTVFAAMVGVALSRGSGFGVQGSEEGRGARNEGRGASMECGGRDTALAGGEAALKGGREKEGSGGDKETRRQGDKGTQERMPVGVIAPVVVAALGLSLVLLFVFVSVSRSAAALTSARALPLSDAESHYRAAAEADPLDPVPLSEMVERMGREPTPEGVHAMVAAVDEAISRDPRQISLYRLRAQVHVLRYSAKGEESDLQEAIASMRQALELYPNSPDEHLGMATVLAHAAAATGSREWVKEASEEYAKALELDDARPGTDEVRKWSPRRRAEIEAAMAALSQATDTQPSQNATQTRPDGG